MPVSSLSFTNLGPFQEISFDFDANINVFVGPNNCGKTTALMALASVLRARAFPEKLIRRRPEFDVEFLLPSGEKTKERFDFLPNDTLGIMPDYVRETLPKMGFRTFIPALRLSTEFRSQGPGSKNNPKTPKTRKNDEQPPNSCQPDKDVIQDIIDLDYRGYRERKSHIHDLIGRIGSLASEITEGFPIEFHGIGEDKNGYYPSFRTPDGILPLNLLSQGTQSLIQWCANFLIGYARYFEFPKCLDDCRAVLIVDDIDAHLHPTWQRRVLPTLRREFPSLQVFCATHSPLTIAGLRAGQVQLLEREAPGKISVTRNASDILGWSVDEIYSAFLGVEPTDLLTSDKLSRLRDLRRKPVPLTDSERDELQQLRNELHHDLMHGAAMQETETLAMQMRERARDHSSSASLQQEGTSKHLPPGKGS